MIEILTYLLYRVAVGVVALAPLPAVAWFGRRLGGVAWLSAGGVRRLAIRNLTIAYGREKERKEIRKLARQHFLLLGMNVLSSVKFATMRRDHLSRYVDVAGFENLEQAMAGGRGVVFVLMHASSWELMAQIVPEMMGREAGCVYQALRNGSIDRHVKALRARRSCLLFERKEGFAAAIDVIRRGGGVGVLADQHAGDGGVWCPFFGRLASTTTLPALMAVRARAGLIPVVVETVGACRWRLSFEPEVTPTSREPETITAQLNGVLERQIRRNPADWFWVHNRWKTPRPKFLLTGYKRGIAVPITVPVTGLTARQKAERVSQTLQPFRILIRSSNWLGDAVMTVPAVRAIKRGRPDAHITLLTPAKLADMWENVPEVDDVIPFLVPSGRGILKSIRGLFTLFSAAGEVRKGGPFEVAILFPNSLRTALEVWLAGIPRRIGFEGHGMRKWLLNQVLRPAKAKKGKPALADPPVHQVNHYLKLVTFVGGRVEDGLSAEPDGEIHAPPSGTFAGAIPPEEAEHPPLPEQEIEGERIGGIGLGLRLAPVHPVLRQVRIGVCPGAEYGPAKRWFPERFAEVMTMIDAEYRCAWVLFGAARDVPVAAAMEPLLAGLTVENLVGRTTMAELIDELRRCHLLLTNDTGTMHLAALLGVRTVSIFGSTEPLLTGPLGPDHLVIRHQVECSPCFLRTCPIDFRCMKTIDAFEVAATVSAALEQGVPNLES